jgi:polygalacturonase
MCKTTRASAPGYQRARRSRHILLASMAARLVLTCATILSSSTALGDGTGAKVALPTIPKNSLNIADCGGVGDGLTLNTKAFEKAIGQLAEKGGGQLEVPPGIWFTGAIQLQSNIDLHLDRGTLVKFSADPTQYPLIVVDTKGEKEVTSTSPIFGQNLENVAITGPGILDGSGDAWRQAKKNKLPEGDWKALLKTGGVLNDKADTWWPNESARDGEKLVDQLTKSGSLDPKDYEPAHTFLRPKMLRLINCKRVLIQDVTVQNPPMWTINPLLCEDVSILNVTIHNSPAAQNSDALDLESCRRAHIANCTFDAGDDGICIKSGKDAAGRRIGVPTEDVLVEGCTVYHAHGGFVIGSEMSGGVKNVRVNNCTFIGTEVGLRFKTTRGRGGVVEDIDISNIQMMNILTDAINFNMYYASKSVAEGDGNGAPATVPPVTEETPQFRGIHIRNVVCRGAGAAMVLQGLPEMPLKDVTLKDVSISADRGVAVTDVDGVHFDNVRVTCKSGNKITTTRASNSTLDIQE